MHRARLYPAALITAAFALVLAGCAPRSATAEAAAVPAAPPDPANTLAFTQAACGGCHAVEAPGLSPNPESPTFADIANRPGLTETTLKTWLTDAHNYPEVMDFDLDPEQVERIADYMLTLRDPDYEKPIY